MKIATFNINHINKRLPNLLRWLKSRKPDIVCLQELKCAQIGVSADTLCAKPATTRCGAASAPGTASPFCRETASRS